MNALPLALSLSSSFTKVGAIAAFVALVGIAILSLLVFSQAREIKRLREWAGRAPERAAEMEQRVSAGAAARVQRGSAPMAPQGRVVPRTTPLVSAPVATAVNASAAAVRPATAQPAAAQPAVSPQTAAAAAPAVAQPGAPAAPSDARGAPPSAVSEPVAQADQPSAASPADEPSPAQAAPAASAGAIVTAESAQEKAPATPAPVTAAAQDATRTAPRAPLPPSPAAPKPASPRSGSIPAAQASSSRVVSSRPRAAVATTGSAAAASRSAAGAGASPAVEGGRKDFRQERSPTRVIVLAVGVLIVVVLVLIFAVSALKGGSSPTPASTRGSTGSEAATSRNQGTTTKHSTSRQAVAANPAETAVVVLNGTATTGLAHHLASDLKQSGYTQALASAAVPPGTHQTTVVEYSSGHRADAQGVARTLNVTQVQPLESTIAGLAGTATVIVLAGADQAALLGGGGAQSQGEPAAGQ